MILLSSERAMPMRATPQSRPTRRWAAVSFFSGVPNHMADKLFKKRMGRRQVWKEIRGETEPLPSRDAPDFGDLAEIASLQASGDMKSLGFHFFQVLVVEFVTVAMPL